MHKLHNRTQSIRRHHSRGTIMMAARYRTPLSTRLALLVAAASLWLLQCGHSLSTVQDDLFAGESSPNDANLAPFQMPDYVIDDLADGDQLYAGLGLESAASGDSVASAASPIPDQPSDGKRSLARRQLQVFGADFGEPAQSGLAKFTKADERQPSPFASAFQANTDFDSSGASYPLANFYIDQPQQSRPLKSGHLKTPTSSSSSPSMSRQQLADEQQQQQAELEHEARLLQQNQNKIGPQFVKEPPSFIHYLNSSDLIVPCAASGNPAPTITWWQKSQQLKLGSLLDKRYVRYDNALVISAFKAHEFEPEIHSASYRCQASNPLGTIISRDVVINAVIDKEYEANVADQFVTADNDALFKCQLPPQVRDFYQVIGWLEDGQQLVAASSAVGPAYGSLFGQLASSNNNNMKDGRRRQQQRAIMLPSGHLYIQRVQLRDANKSYKCQIKNLLSGRLSSSTISGRLFVTDANESGASPRIIDGPGLVATGRLGDPMLLACLAQGSPRPTVRWFRWQRGGGGDQRRDNENLITTSDQDEAAWVELQQSTTGSQTATSAFQQQSNSSLQQQMQTGAASSAGNANQSSSGEPRYLLSSEGNVLLFRSLQASEQRAKFKCLANNSFGAHQLETELRLDSWWPIQKSIELRPRIEFIQDVPQQQQQDFARLDKTSGGSIQVAGSAPASDANRALTLNCTVRMTSQPLVAIEWLKNGRQLFSVSLASYAQLEQADGDTELAATMLPAIGQPNMSNARQSQFASIFDDPNQELTLVEQFARLQQQLHTSPDGQTNQQASDDSLIQFNVNEAGSHDQLLSSNNNGDSSQSISTSSTLDKLSQMPDRQHQLTARSSRIWHSLRVQQADQLLYQLNFNSLRRSDRGSYQCRTKSVQLSVGPDSSARSIAILQQTSQLLLKDTPPKFMETFASKLVDEHSRQQVSLKCIASGSPLPEISWQLSGFQVPESSRFRVGDYVTRDGLIVSFVNITSVQPEDGGLYECSASNDVGQLRHSAWLNVTGPAHIRPMPNVSAIAGGSLAIMCPVGGWPIEQISWFQNSAKLPSNHRQKMFPNGTLVISELNEILDSGQYACQAKSAGSDHFAHQQVVLSIKVPPVVEPFTFAKSLHRGQRYNIMCMVTRGDLPVSIRWFKDGQPIESVGAFIQAPMDDQQQQQQLVALQTTAFQQQQQQQELSAASSQQNYGLAIKQLDPYSSTLTFASLQSRHRGVYSCEAINEVGRANQSSPLVIHVPPEWRIEPNDLSVTIGRTAVIDCQADGFPAARVEWRLSQDLYREPPSEFKPIISSLYMRVFENGSLIIYNTQRTDAGYYLCQANNGIGPGISKVIKLTVHVAAHFKSKIRTELVRVGQTARLKCEAFGDLPIEISWLKDKLPLYGQEEPRYALTSNQLQEGILSELVVHETIRTDSALFTCITQNQFGTDDTNIQLVVQGAPDPPDELRVQEYEARSAKLTWLPGHSGNSPVNKYILMYAPVGQLVPATSLTTVASTNRNYPLSSNAVQQQQQQLQFQYQWTNITIQGNETSYLLHGLTPLTEYSCHLIAINSMGNSRLPNEPLKFRTDDEAPSLPPVFVKAQPISSRAIRVKWRAAERRRDQHYGLVSGFYVGYKLYRPTGSASSNNGDQQQQQAELVANSPEMVSSGGRAGGSALTLSSTKHQDTPVYKTIEFNSQRPVLMADDQTATTATNATANKSLANLEHECLLSPLKRHQKYLITVQPFNGRGAGPASEPVVAETWRVDVPDAPSLRMIARTTRSIHLAWRLAQTVVASSSSEQTTKLTPSAFKAAVAQSQHQRSSQYSDRILAQHNQQQSSAASSSARLDELLQMSPEELAAEEAQANEPILGYLLTRKQLITADQQRQAATHGQPSIINSAQQHQLDNQPAVELRLPSDQTTHLVDNLTCGTRYQFTIAAINSVGVSAPSEPLVVKTDGSVPVAPDRSSLLSLNASSVVINLGAWHNGACSMRSFDVLFKRSGSKKWSTLTNYQFGANQQQQGSTGSNASKESTSGSSLHADAHSPRSLITNGNYSETNQRSGSSSSSSNQHDLQAENGTIVLDDLAISVNYDLKILATNEAGSTEALYTFNTNGNSISSLDQQWSSATGGEFQFSDASLNDFLASSGSIATLLPLILLLLLISLSLSTGCIMFARRRRASSSNCSLSSSSRSNQSSANYCGTTTTTTTTTSAGLQATAGCRDQMLYSGAGDSSTMRLPPGHQQHQQLVKGASATLMPSGASRRIMNGLEHASGGSLDDSPLLAAHHQQQQHQNAMRLSEIYGTHQRPMMQQIDKSHYAYLTAGRVTSASQQQQLQQHQNRPSSPHNTDITSVLNGSEETEMCLGASALNLSGAGQNHHQNHESDQSSMPTAGVLQHMYNSNTLNMNKGGQSNGNCYQRHQQQQPAVYQMDGQPTSGKLASQLLLGQLSKSSTLPTNCHQQQLLQKLLAAQQQQATDLTQQQQQALVDPFMAANMMLQHHQDLATAECQELDEDASNQQQVAAYALQAAMQAANNQQQPFDQTMMNEALVNMNNMLDPANNHHHQQQVYATVKRGCPRPPPTGSQQRQTLCDYTGIYQCPATGEPLNQQQRQQQQQQQQHDPSSQLLMGSCCSGGQTSSSGIGSEGQAALFCYNQPAQQQDQSSCLANTQQQQHQSDYQQLRTIN